MRFIELVEHYLEQRKDEIHSEEELIKEKKLVPLSFSPFTHKLSLFVCVCVCAGVRVSDELADRSRYKSADLEG